MRRLAELARRRRAELGMAAAAWVAVIGSLVLLAPVPFAVGELVALVVTAPVAVVVAAALSVWVVE